MQSRFFLGVVLLNFGWVCHGQAPRREPTPNDSLQSPEVLASKRVTFRIYAPKASEVSIGGDWISQGLGTGGKVEKDAAGVWSITVGMQRR